MNGLSSGKCFLILIPESKYGGLFFKETKARVEFNDNTVQTVEVHKHLSLSLDKKLVFNIHNDNKINKCNKTIGIMRWLLHSILHDSLLTIYKTFVCPYLDYADVRYDKSGNVNFE